MQNQTQPLSLLSSGGNFSSAALSPGHNWNTDVQITYYQTLEEFHRHAQSASGNFLDLITETRNSIDPDIEIVATNLVKPKESLNRKMHDPSVNYNMQEICDPVRVTLVVDSVPQLKKAINKITGLEECTSTKNEFVNPNAESHFSTFKARLRVKAPDGRYITGEVQVQHKGMIRANELTCRLSDSARAMEKAAIEMADTFRSNEKSYRRHLSDLHATRDFVNRVKCLIHDSARIASGLIELIPSNQRGHYMVDGVELGPVPRYAKTVMLLLPDAFIKRVKSKAPMTSEGITSDFKLV